MTGTVDSPDLISAETFAAFWKLRPKVVHYGRAMFGRRHPKRRRQQAFRHDYAFGGQVNRAKPVPELLAPFLDWSRLHVDVRLNGFFLNWYDAALQEKIPAHRDEDRDLVEGTSIVTISLGAPRTFLLREFRGKARHDSCCRERHGDHSPLDHKSTVDARSAAPR